MSLTSAFPGDARQAAATLALPSREKLDYTRSLLEVVALLVGLTWLVWYTSKVGPARAAERIARGRIG